MGDGPLDLPLDDLVDHHCHGLLPRDLERAEFESLMNEAPGPVTLGTTLFDSMLGLAVRRHCAPVLDLEPLASAEDYLQRRLDLGGAEVNGRLMAATGIGTLLVDTGLGRPTCAARTNWPRCAAGRRTRWCGSSGWPSRSWRRGPTTSPARSCSG